MENRVFFWALRYTRPLNNGISTKVTKKIDRSRFTRYKYIITPQRQQSGLL